MSITPNDVVKAGLDARALVTLDLAGRTDEACALLNALDEGEAKRALVAAATIATSLLTSLAKAKGVDREGLWQWACGNASARNV